MNVPILPNRRASILCTWIFLTFIFGLVQNRANALTVTCPEDVVIQLGPHACGAIVALHTLDFETTVPLVDTVFFPETNTTFPIGTTVVTMATADIDGNLDACTFNVTILDYLGPEVLCEASIILSLEGDCERSVDAEEVLDLDLNGCADNFVLFRVDSNNITSPPLITAFDFGNQVTIRALQPETGEYCETQVTVLGGAPPAITCPPDITIICNTPADSVYTGTPDLDGCYENVLLTYIDQMTPRGCTDSFAYQIVRQWKATDPFGQMDFCTQIITAKKFNVNLVTFPPDRDGIDGPAIFCNDTLSWEEAADPEVSGFPVYNGFSPDVSPHCKISVTFLDFETNLCGESWEIKRVWKVVKTCAPFVTLQDTQNILILDPYPPTFEVPDSIFVSLSADCDTFVTLPAANVLSECSAYDILIETPWDTLTANGGVLHFDTLVAGVYTLKYILTDDCGNVGEAEPILIISNGVLVDCPPDTSVNCDFFADTLNIAVQIGNEQTAAFVGNPVYYANCVFDVNEVDSVDVNSCGVGLLRRYLTNESDNHQVTCVQNVTVTSVSDFEVLFPANISICTTLAAGNTGQPVLFNVSCENITVDYTDDITLGGVAGCFTVHRTFMVKNICTFNGNTSIPDSLVATRRYKDGGDGYIEYTQVIQVNNSAGPAFPSGCSIGNINLPNDGCAVTFTVPTPVVVGCGGIPNLQVSGDLGNTLGAKIPLFPGSYNVVYTATDSCGKTKTCSANFNVIDPVQPIAKCRSPFTVEPLTALTALEIDNGSEDNCSNLYFSFAKDSLDELRVFPCCANGIYDITLWVTDPSGFQDSCHTFVLVDPDTVVCVCDVDLSGHVRTEDNESVAHVSVTASSTAGYIDSVLTTQNGLYHFMVTPGSTYSISAYKNSGLLNGVTTFDQALITKHILGITPLGSPYKIIAADINASNTVTTFDMVEMRRAILGISSSFPNNTSWRFVPAYFVFPNPNNPFQTAVPGAITLNNLQSDMTGLDFIAIKIGDVNSSADPTMLTGFPDHRSAASVQLTIPDLSMEQGQVYNIPVTLEQATLGCQFVLRFDPAAIQLDALQPHVGTLENYVLDEKNGLVKASWFAPDFKPLTNESLLFNLRVMARKTASLTDVVHLDRSMPDEAYGNGWDIRRIDLNFSQVGGLSETFELYPARPNPFNRSTVFSFRLPVTGPVELSVTDIAGKSVWNKSLSLEKGMHGIELTRADLPLPGTYFFKLETAEGVRVQKIVLNE